MQNGQGASIWKPDGNFFPIGWFSGGARSTGPSVGLTELSVVPEGKPRMNIAPVPTPAMLPVRSVPHLPWPVAERVFVIAEIGINHNGDLDLAKRLIDVAQAAGCDAVKFQKRSIDVVYTPEVLDQPRESPWGTTQRAQKEG